MTRILSAAALMFCWSALTHSASTQTAWTPEYCASFSSEACQRIKSVVETKVRPAYCVPGFGRVGSGLAPEQLRICYAMPNPVSTESQQQLTAERAKQNQRIEDARAMVREDWVEYGRSIAAIETGYKCDVVDQISANVAIDSIQNAMQNRLIHAGLIGDQTMSVRKVAAESVQTGKENAQKGACSRMTPAMRARLRSMVADLMR